MNRKGFTLVEGVVAMLACGVLFAAIISGFVLQKRTYTSQEQAVQMQQSVRAALMTMNQELAMAGYVPEGTGNAPDKDVFNVVFNDDYSGNIQEADVTVLTFMGDVDDDGSSETVRYAWSGTSGDSLMREAWEWDTGTASWAKAVPSDDETVLADEIDDLAFSYFAEDNEQPWTSMPLGATERQDVRRIAIDVTGRTSMPSRYLSMLLERELASLVALLPSPFPREAFAQTPASDGRSRMRIKSSITPENLGDEDGYSSDDSWGDDDSGSGHGSSSARITI